MKRLYMITGSVLLFLLVVASTIRLPVSNTHTRVNHTHINHGHAYAMAFTPKRFDGKNRFQVAVNVARTGWPSGAHTVLITNAAQFADSLAATPLAYEKNAPILLTRPNNLPGVIKQEIIRLHPKHIIVVGGSGSVSNLVLSQLQSLVGSGHVDRIGGKNRFQVAYNIARQLNQKTAIITNGLVYSDALAIAPYAAENHIPILLTTNSKLPAYTRDALAGMQKTLVIGGVGSVGPSVYAQLPNPQRIGGQNRYQVAANIINTLHLNTNRIFLATGLKFADALTGSVLAARENAPLLLMYPGGAPIPTEKLVLNNNIKSFAILGGIASIPEKTVYRLHPIQNHYPIQGYTDKNSYDPGETVHVMVSSPNGKFSVEVLRYGAQVKEMYRAVNIPGRQQNYYPDAYKVGAMWKPSYSFKIPSGWSSGMYAVKIYDASHDFYIPFIVKNMNPAPNSIVVIASTNTWEAYNSWGGKSLYSYTRVKNNVRYNPIVSFERPNPRVQAGHLAGGEKYILKWLEDNHYQYSMITDRDLSRNPRILKKFKAVIISTHSEYWSDSMMNGLKSYLNRGGNLLYLSGDGLYWQVVYNGNQIEVEKNGLTQTFDHKMGGSFSHLGKPESAVVGERYQSTGFTMPAPYKVLDSSSWVFAHTGLHNGNLIGKVGLNKIRGSSGGASGWETDQTDKYTPRNAVLLAKGVNRNGASADMIYYQHHPGGGGVFSVGSISFGGSLAVEPQLTQIVKNVLNHFGAN